MFLIYASKTHAVSRKVFYFYVIFFCLLYDTVCDLESVAANNETIDEKWDGKKSEGSGNTQTRHNRGICLFGPRKDKG